MVAGVSVFFCTLNLNDRNEINRVCFTELMKRLNFGEIQINIGT